MKQKFRNRTEAGQLLAKKLAAYANHSDLLILGLPRGGVPVAFKIATALNAPLDICIVRKLGVPKHEELAMGAIATGGVMVLNKEVLNSAKISQPTIEKIAAREKQELTRRDRLYRGNRPLPELENRTVILVDDGIATGSTLQAAIAIVRQQQPKKIIVAVPVAPPSTCNQLKEEVDEVVCLMMPEPLRAIGLWYDDFLPTTDAEVKDLLTRAERQRTQIST
jgi:putative phosphoribosyl transferase